MFGRVQFRSVVSCVEDLVMNFIEGFLRVMSLVDMESTSQIHSMLRRALLRAMQNTRFRPSQRLAGRREVQRLMARRSKYFELLTVIMFSGNTFRIGPKKYEKSTRRWYFLQKRNENR